MGKVYRYDVTTRSKDLVLDHSSRPVRDDAGLQTIAFHPDFQSNGKLYVSSAEDNTGVAPTSRVEEFIVTNTGTAAGYIATPSRIILQYNGIALSGNHNFGWILRGDETLADGTLGAKEFASSEHATASYRPTLTVTSAVPEPAMLAPLVIGALALIRRRPLI
jgi:hypothetical protein